MNPNDNTPALNSDGTLKDASEIKFIHSPSHEHHSLPSTGENTTPEDPHVPHTNLDGPTNVKTSEQKGKGKPKEVTTWVGHKHMVKALEKLIKVNENLQGTGLNPGTKHFLQHTLDGVYCVFSSYCWLLKHLDSWQRYHINWGNIIDHLKLLPQRRKYLTLQRNLWLDCHAHPSAN